MTASLDTRQFLGKKIIQGNIFSPGYVDKKFNLMNYTTSKLPRSWEEKFAHLACTSADVCMWKYFCCTSALQLERMSER